MEDPSWPWPDSPGIFALNESFEDIKQLKNSADMPTNQLRRTDSRPDNKEDVVRIPQSLDSGSRRFSPYRRALSHGSKDSLKDLEGGSGSMRIGSPFKALELVGSPAEKIQGFNVRGGRPPVTDGGADLTADRGSSWNFVSSVSGMDFGTPANQVNRRSSAPMAVPGVGNHDVEAIIEAAEKSGKFIPPHELARMTGSSHNMSESDTSPFSTDIAGSMPDPGMGLKGRDALRVRNLVLGQTGFLEERETSSVESDTDVVPPALCL